MLTNIPTVARSRIQETKSIICSFNGDRVDPTSMHQIRFTTNKTGPAFPISYFYLSNASIPNTIPNIVNWSSWGSLQNDQFNFSDGGSFNFTIPENLWDGPSLAAEIQSQMNTATSSTDYTVTFDLISSKFTFTTANPSMTLDFSALNTPAYELGFLNTSYSGPVIVSPNVCNLQGTSHIFFTILELQSSQSITYNSYNFTFAIPMDKASSIVQIYSSLFPGGNPQYTNETPKSVQTYTISAYFERQGEIFPLICDELSHYTLTFSWVQVCSY